MSIFIIVLLIVVGICLVLLEILVLPGFIVGVAGAAMMVAGVGGTYLYHGFMWGNIALLVTVAGSLVAVYFALNSKTWRKLSLQTEIDGRVNNPDVSLVKPGDRGVTVTRLAPMGRVRIDTLELEAKSEESLIDAGVPVEVVSVGVSNVVVQRLNEA